MQEKDAKKLFDKVKDGSITTAEKALLDEWYLQYNEADQIDLVEQDYQAAEDKIWARLNVNLTVAPVKRMIAWRTISIAASLALFLAFAVFFISRKATTVNQNQIAQNVSRKISADQNNLIQLPDGSTVVLYKGSKLNYAWTSGKKIREVFLTGRAFFDIKHDVNRPFIVRAGRVKTTVLGTAFDVVADSASNEVVVRVVRGKVNVSTDKAIIGDLLPNKKVTYNVKTDLSSFANAKPEHEMQWTTQDMVLNDITFEGICEELENRYHVKIDIASEDLKYKKFTISIGANENLNNFLKTVCDFNKAVFTVNPDNNQFIISAAK